VEWEDGCRMTTYALRNIKAGEGKPSAVFLCFGLLWCVFRPHPKATTTTTTTAITTNVVVVEPLGLLACPPARSHRTPHRHD
jgi:hypothetical protein